jgi:hypothetical protein
MRCTVWAPRSPDLGDFTWNCAHGRLEGSLLLAPTRPERIQAWQLAVIKP